MQFTPYEKKMQRSASAYIQPITLLKQKDYWQSLSLEQFDRIYLSNSFYFQHFPYYYRMKLKKVYSELIEDPEFKNKKDATVKFL